MISENIDPLLLVLQLSTLHTGDNNKHSILLHITVLMLNSCNENDLFTNEKKSPSHLHTKFEGIIHNTNILIIF